MKPPDREKCREALEYLIRCPETLGKMRIKLNVGLTVEHALRFCAELPRVVWVRASPTSDDFLCVYDGVVVGIAGPVRDRSMLWFWRVDDIAQGNAGSLKSAKAAVEKALRESDD